MKRVVRYTVHSIVGQLVETTPMGGPQSWALGHVKAESYGDDGSMYSWPLAHGVPQPVVGSVFVHEVTYGIEGTFAGVSGGTIAVTVSLPGSDYPEVGDKVTVTVNP